MRSYKLIFLTLALLAVGLLGKGTTFLTDAIKGLPNQEKLLKQAEEKAVAVMGKPLELVLKRTYLCGPKDEERVRVEPQTIEQLLSKYIGWEIASVGADSVVLKKAENDLSPLCKSNGHFGLSQGNVLTLFNGLPGEQKVIQTFYQINTARLEAGLPKNELDLLKKGIRVHDLAEYNSILSTYSEFQNHEKSGTSP
ncbi:BofC C-terminal domain-containing protein [Brevibacillus ginsengisoli]|uniref:BofC C-terminal domain-containing protein n=1 Tax=Brevibacillus ginsengisoli TaxID=363854 RepID=UPI003CEE9F24